MQKGVVIIGFLLGLALIVFQYLEFSYNHSYESKDLYLLIISISFLSAGILIGKKLTKKTVIEMPDFEVDLEMIGKLGISSRELEVLEHLSQGFSNQEIADHLFISLNTIKTHISNLYVKLDVDRRTKAISRAKELRLLV